MKSRYLSLLEIGKERREVWVNARTRWQLFRNKTLEEPRCVCFFGSFFHPVGQKASHPDSSSKLSFLLCYTTTAAKNGWLPPPTLPPWPTPTPGRHRHTQVGYPSCTAARVQKHSSRVNLLLLLPSLVINGGSISGDLAMEMCRACNRRFWGAHFTSCVTKCLKGWR